MNLSIEQLKRILEWHHVFSCELSTKEIDEELSSIFEEQLEKQIEEAPREIRLKEYLTRRFIFINGDFECIYCKKMLNECECDELSLDEFESLVNENKKIK